jgi:hypothetical protein
MVPPFEREIKRSSPCMCNRLEEKEKEKDLSEGDVET